MAVPHCVIFHSDLGVPECDRFPSRCISNSKLFVVKLTSHPQLAINRCHCMHSNMYIRDTTYKGCIGEQSEKENCLGNV